MRITFVLPGWSIHKPVGGFKVVYEYANRLSERGHQINVVHPLLLFPDEARLKQKMKRCALQTAKHFWRNSKVKWLSVSPKVNMLIVGSLKKENIPEGDVIIATAWQTVEWVVGYSSTKGAKFYLMQDFYPWLGPRERLEATWRDPLKKVVVSHWLYEKVIQAGGTDVTVIPNGIDFQTFRLLADPSDRTPRVTMLFSPVNYKASNDGLQALEICKKQYPELIVSLFGPGQPFREIPHWVTYYKNMPMARLVELFNQSKIYVCSSVAEGFAFPPAEAMACGCAVVSTDCGGIREYTEHEVNALLSPPKDPQALAQNILRLLEDDDLRVKLAKAGYERIQKFTWDKAVTKLEEVLGQK
jgi:glycosyltransferase involved in cell wall biosynthesis